MSSGGEGKTENLSLEKIGELMFDVIKLKADECERVALTTNRYDTKEVMLKAGIDPTPYLTTKPILFHNHEVRVQVQSSKTVQVIFRDVPLCIPDEEIINLCQCYGEPINKEVRYRPSEGGTGLY